MTDDNIARRHRHGQAWDHTPLPERRATWRGLAYVLVLAGWGLLLFLVLR